VAGSIVYVADADSGLQVIDITTQTIVGSVGVPDLQDAATVSLAGGYLYVADRVASKVFALDIANPAAPTVIGGIETPDDPLGLAIDIDYAYVANGAAGLTVLPSHCPEATPVEMAWFELVPGHGHVTIAWATAYEQDHVGFNILRAEPDQTHFGTINDGPIRGAGTGRYEFIDATVAPNSTYVYSLEAIDVFGGRQIFELGSVAVGRTVPRHLVLHQNHPNPFNPSTEIAFDLPAARHVKLRIYDVAGRSVRTLIDDRLDPDVHSVRWDGRDDRGQRLSSGVFFYRLDAGDRTLSRKLVIVE
jgi:hypothetical protein